MSRRLEGASSHDLITRWLSSTAWGSADLWRQAKLLIRQVEAWQRPEHPVRKSVALWDAKNWWSKYQNPFTKNQYLQQMLRVTQQQVAYRYLLADSRYTSAEDMALGRTLGHHFVFALESSAPLP